MCLSNFIELVCDLEKTKAFYQNMLDNLIAQAWQTCWSSLLSTLSIDLSMGSLFVRHSCLGWFVLVQLYKIFYVGLVVFHGVVRFQ